MLAANAQTTVDPITGQVSIVIDPATGSTLTITQGQPLEELKNQPTAVNVSDQLGDDGSVTVQLPFEFDYYGQTFESVKMLSNGVLSFTGQGNNYCCDGQDISELTHPSHNYIIAAAWTDLYTLPDTAYYLGTEDSMMFGWYGVIEYYNPSARNSFEIELYSAGDIDLRYGGISIKDHTVSAGLTGDLSQDQYIDLYFGQGFDTKSTITPDVGGPDPCIANPLVSPSCSGYEQAYYAQQCSLNPLYDSGCPGYQQAYYTQQCSLDPLYDSGCPGYQQAYYDQQCSLNPLYDVGCPGYQQAYYEQQCAADPLYDKGCEGYRVAYVLQQQQLQQQEQMDTTYTAPVLEASETGDPALDEVLSVLPEPVQLDEMQQEMVQTVTVEEVSSTEPATEATPEDKAAAEEMMAEVVGETNATDKPSPEKQKAAIAAKIAELKKELASGNMSAKEVAAAQAKLSVLISFVPGFDQYYVVIPDAPFYQQEQVYQNQQLPTNRSALRMGLASELKHQEMVQMQYNRRD